ILAEYTGFGTSKPRNATGRNRERILRNARRQSVRNRSHIGSAPRDHQRRSADFRHRSTATEARVDDPPGEESVGPITLSPKHALNYETQASSPCPARAIAQRNRIRPTHGGGTQEPQNRRRHRRRQSATRH